MAISAREAIAAARSHFLELFPEAADNVRLEEVDHSGEDWAITFSMSGPSFSLSPFGVGRVAKVVLIDPLTGEFLSLRQRAA